MRKFILVLLIIIISILGLSACTANEEPIEDELEHPIDENENEDLTENGDTELPVGDESKTWPVSIDDTIEIEANNEPITLNYFEGENFITYIPSDMIGEPYATDEGDAYRFYTNYQGNKNNEVYLQILFYPEDMNQKPDILGDAVDIIEDSDKYHEWTIEEYISKDGFLHGFLGQHKDRYFSIITNSMEEYSEGFIPRANKIIQYIYFTDTNEYLVKE
ncbi:hypothetical protein [Tissierella sp. Yu-01]|uniref:hypothetical protein n=1 Tax=Tissierella sp. Yu-01 TaxID=3035694 RepID=UPI00240DA894|nr:hypothetical protein [Tissierella sp. Yu-01]WFA07786.1 hypothetical protein P3962_08570 [Tissierella sp. Yu-01]